MAMRKRNEPVRLTRIYTRGGDAGETSLGDGTRVAKTDPRIVAGGDVDELNSSVGWAAVAADGEVRATLERIQNELFDLGADLSVPASDAKRERLRVTQAQIDALEAACDAFNAALEPLTSFVLPGGTEVAARMFLARAVCRRAERAVLGVPDANALMATYLNRLSDLLFILARTANAGRAQPGWVPGGMRAEKPQREEAPGS
jgi:cob(I)alamin adenosyltransferase